MSSVPPADSSKPGEQRSSGNAWPPGTPRQGVAAVKASAPATAGDTSLVSGAAVKTFPAAGTATEVPEVFGKYRIVRKLGQGGMAVVYLAEDTVLHRQVAIKVPLDEVQRDPELVKRFLREAQSAAGLTHPNICHVYDNGEIAGRHFIAMEFVDGKSLAAASRGIEIKERLAADLVRRIAITLSAAHDKGIIHRDLKPSNILLTKVSNRLEPKITDFGLAKRLDIKGSDLSKMGSFMGTPAYVSKEQALGEPPTPAMDIYSLGVVLYELLAGRLPFEGPDTVNVLAQVLMNQPAPPSTHRPGLCPKLEAICLKAVAKDPHERYASMADFAAALSDWLRGNPKTEKTDTGLLAVHPKPLASARFRGRRPPLIATVLGAAAIIALGIVFYIATNNGTIKIELSDPTAQVEVKVDGDRLDITGLAQPLSFRAGPHGLEVTGKDFETVSQMFTVKRGNNPLVRVELVAKPPSLPSPPPPVPLPQPVPQRAAAADEVRRFEGHKEKVLNVTFSPDGRRALSASEDRTVRLWDVESGKVIRVFEGHIEGVMCACFSPDGRFALSGGHKILRLWNVETGQEIRQLAGHTSGIRSIAYLPDGKRALSGAEDKTLRLWNVETGAEIRRFEGHTQPVFSAAVSSDGRRAVSAAWGDGIVRLWDLEKGTELRSLEGHTSNVLGVAFAPDNRHAYSASYDNTVRIWDVETGAEVRRFEKHTGHLWCVSVSSDGKRALSGGSGGIFQDGQFVRTENETIRLWETATGEETLRIDAQPGWIRSLAFSPDGRYALLASDDPVIRLWRLPDPETRTAAHAPAVSPPALQKQLEEKIFQSLVTVKVAGDDQTTIGVVTNLGVCTIKAALSREVTLTTLDGKRTFAGTIASDEIFPFCWIDAAGLDLPPLAHIPPGSATKSQDVVIFLNQSDEKKLQPAKIEASGALLLPVEYLPRHVGTVGLGPVFSLDGNCLGISLRHNLDQPNTICKLERRSPAQSPAAPSPAPSSEKYDPTINFKFFSKWHVTRGSVDISGNGFNDVLPGNDLYLDLDGTTGGAVKLESKAAFNFKPGSDYELRFDLAGSQGDDGINTVHVSLGDAFKEDFTLPSTAPFRTITRTIKVNQPTSAKLVFDHDGSDNAGLHLDNVKLTDTTNRATLLHDDFFHIGDAAESAPRLAPSGGKPARNAESSSPGSRAGSSPPPKVKASTKRPAGTELKQLEADVRNAARLKKSATTAASIRSRLVELINSQPESPFAIQAAALMRQVACPADGLQRNAIAASELAAARGRDQVQVPAALVAVFGASVQIARINSVEFSPDGQVLAAGSQDGTVRVWDLAGGAQQWSVSHGPGARWITFSPDGKLLLSGGGTVVKVWDAATGNEVRQFQSQKGEIQSLAFSPDGSLLAASDTERGVHLFDAATGQLQTRLEGQIDGLGQVAISPDGSMVAAGTFNHIMECWDVRSGKERRTAPSNAGWIHSVAFSPDGQVIAGAGDDHQVRIWDRASLNQLKSLGQSNNVDCVAFSRDGKTLAATASPDGKGTLMIWDWPSCQTRMTLSLGVPLFQFAMSLEGRYIAATSENGAVYVFRLAQATPP